MSSKTDASMPLFGDPLDSATVAPTTDPCPSCRGRGHYYAAMEIWNKPITLHDQGKEAMDQIRCGTCDGAGRIKR